MNDRLLAAVVVALIVLELGSSALWNRAKIYGHSDLIAFYCAGRVANAGLDPYRTVPLLACERATQILAGVPADRLMDGVDPAPLPQTTLLAFRPFALLPYRLAAPFFTLAVAALFALAVWALAQTIRLPWWALAAPLALADFDRNAIFGQLPPVCLAVFALAGLALARGRPGLAGAVACVALVQPNAALPVLLALVLWVPGARAAVVAGAALFAVLGLALGGVPLALEYVREVVPFQALGEVYSENQLSLTRLAWFAGAPDDVAVKIGGAGSALALVLTATFARRAATLLQSEAVVVYLPAAGSVLFCEYLHANQLAYALPFVFAVAAGGPARLRVPAWTAVVLLSVHFYADTRFVALMALAIVAVAVRFALPALSLRARAAAATGTLGLVALAALAGPRASAAPLRTHGSLTQYLATGADTSIAAGANGAEARRSPSNDASSPRALAPLVPEWIGLALVVAIAIALPRTKGNQSRAEGG